MATINNEILPHLLELGLVKMGTTGQWPRRSVHYELNLAVARRFGLAQSTAYRYLARPPRHWRHLVAFAADLNRRQREAAVWAMPAEWRAMGWRWTTTGELCLGGDRANPFKWHAGDPLATWYRHASLETQLKQARREIDRLKENARRFTAANDSIYKFG